MATIKDIADKLGIAVSTVSKGLNGASDVSNEMKQLVLDTAVEMGYSPRRMRSASTKKVCVMIENMDYENIGQFGYEIVMGFKMAAAARKWEVDVIPSDLNMQVSEKYDSFMLKNGYSGAFLCGFTLHDTWISQLQHTSVPTVLLDNYIEGCNHVGYVGTDSFEGISLAVTHLKNLGHKKIAFLNGTKNSMVSEERYQAFLLSMNNNGLTPDSDLIAYGRYEPDCAKEYTKSFVDAGATAILCGSDMIASGVIKELNRLGLKSPADVSVMGYDDLPIACQLSPALSTIRQDRLDIGKSANLILDGLINGVTVSKLLLRAKLILRDSTAAPSEK